MKGLLNQRKILFWLQLGFTVIVCLFMFVPVVMSILAGLTENYFIGLKSGLTLRWVNEVWMLYSETISLSMMIALACVAVNLLIGVPAAYALARYPGRLSRILEELLVLPIAIPGMALALALISSYGSISWLRTHWGFILLGHVLYTLPFMIRPIVAVLQSFDFVTLEEGAASLGAGFRQRFFQVVIPNAWPGILSGILMTMTLSIGEFNLTWMLHTPLTRTLPVGLADSYASMRLEIGSAYTLIFLGMIMPLLMAAQMINNRSFISRKKQ